MDVFFTLDLIGTAVFAYTGSIAAKQQRFHILGVLYIAFLTAVGGGTLRSILLQTPELFWMKSSAYFIVVCTVVLASYLIKINTNRLWFYVLDSQSLAIFVAIGIQQTLLQGQPLHIAFAMGVLSGIGGGLIRDAITSQPPQALSDPAYPVMMMAAALGSIAAIQSGLSTWSLACLAVLIVVFITIFINYHRTGRLVEYDRTRQNRSDHPAKPAHRHSARAGHTHFYKTPADQNSTDSIRYRSTSNKKPKSWLTTTVHASIVIVLSCVAGFHYFKQSITHATANTASPVPINHTIDEKIQYQAMLQSIEESLGFRQITLAEKQISETRRHSFADHHLDNLIIKTGNLKTYLTALDQADLALASNETGTLKKSITQASSLGFNDNRLDTLKMGLKNLEERAAIEAANINLAKKSFYLHLASAEHHLGLGNLNLAFAEIETARSLGIKNRKLEQIGEQIEIAKAFDATQLTDSDFEYAANRFRQLESAVKLKNINAISTLTSTNKQRRDIFNGLFDRYIEINASVINFSHDNNSKIINATLALENMRLPNGNIAYPPSSYGEIKISLQLTRQGWSKIIW